jgi:hypothetical protein
VSLPDDLRSVFKRSLEYWVVKKGLDNIGGSALKQAS